MLKTTWQILSREPQGGIGPWMLLLCGCLLVVITLLWLGSHVSWSWVFVGLAFVALGLADVLFGGRKFATAFRMMALMFGIISLLVFAIFGIAG